MVAEDETERRRKESGGGLLMDEFVAMGRVGRVGHKWRFDGEAVVGCPWCTE
jgi:hypothetical protein